MPNCPHPYIRRFAWFAADGVQCVTCCDCGAVLAGVADTETAPGIPGVKRGGYPTVERLGGGVVTLGWVTTEQPKQRRRKKT